MADNPDGTVPAPASRSQALRHQGASIRIPGAKGFRNSYYTLQPGAPIWVQMSGTPSARASRKDLSQLLLGTGGGAPPLSVEYNLTGALMSLLPESHKPFKDMRKSYWERGLALFLGLGVSVKNDLPSWSELTQRVFEAIPDGDEVLQYLTEERYSEPAKLAWAHGELRKRFLPVLREALYRKSNFPSHLHGAELRARMCDLNPTLAAVGAFLCQPDRSDWIPNPRVPAILTTNADTLLTSYVRKAYPSTERVLRTVERASAGPIGRRIPVYYLHGMVRFDEKQKLTKEAPDKLVFTELDYFRTYRSSFSIFTYTPLWVFREYTTLFVGTGLTDANIRRLLYWSQRDIKEGYDEERKPVPKRRKIRHYALMEARDAQLRSVTAALLRPLAVQPLWYETHGDLPGILENLGDTTNSDG